MAPHGDREFENAAQAAVRRRVERDAQDVVHPRGRFDDGVRTAQQHADAYTHHLPGVAPFAGGYPAVGVAVAVAVEANRNWNASTPGTRPWRRTWVIIVDSSGP